MDLWSLANFPVLFIEVIRCCVHAMALVSSCQSIQMALRNVDTSIIKYMCIIEF